MTTELASFSDWVLAALPRLFIYPGGAGLVAALLVLRLWPGLGPEPGSGSVPVGRARHMAGLRYLPYELSTASLPALAVAWVGVALLPLPGAVPLPLPADRLALAGVFVASLLLEDRPLSLDPAPALDSVYGSWRTYAHIHMYALVCTGMTLAVLAPLAGGQGLMMAGPEEVGASWAGWLAAGAVLCGLLWLSPLAARHLPDGVRWLGWLGLGAAPVWTWVPAPLPGPAWVGVVCVATIGLAVVALRLSGANARGLPGPYMRTVWAVALWVLAALSLLAALVGI